VSVVERLGVGEREATGPGRSQHLGDKRRQAAIGLDQQHVCRLVLVCP
jgi:hypothetical protein